MQYLCVLCDCMMSCSDIRSVTQEGSDCLIYPNDDRWVFIERQQDLMCEKQTVIVWRANNTCIKIRVDVISICNRMQTENETKSSTNLIEDGISIGISVHASITHEYDFEPISTRLSSMLIEYIDRLTTSSLVRAWNSTDSFRQLHYLVRCASSNSNDCSRLLVTSDRSNHIHVWMRIDAAERWTMSN
jgi:hypothetical protein